MNGKIGMKGFLKSQKGLIYLTVGNLLSASLIGMFWLYLASIQTVEEYGKINQQFSDFIQQFGTEE